MNTKISKTAIAALAVAVIAIGLSGFALSKPGQVVVKEISKLGADSVAGICIGGGSDPVSQMCNVDVNYLNVTTLITKSIATLAGFTSTATSTLPVNTYYGSRVALTQVATTTYANPAPMAYYCNTGADLMVSPNWFIDIKTNNGLWGSVWTAGTTTCSTYGSTCGTATASFVATTSATLFTATYVGSSTADVISWSDGASGGTFYQSHGSSSSFRLKNGECFVIHSDQAGLLQPPVGRLPEDSLLRPLICILILKLDSCLSDQLIIGLIYKDN
jgi:hypothetical protein